MVRAIAPAPGSGSSAADDGVARSSWGHRFKADQADLQVTGATQFVHHGHQLGVFDVLVGAKEDRGVLLRLGLLVQSLGQLRAFDRLVAEKQTMMGGERFMEVAYDLGPC